MKKKLIVLIGLIVVLFVLTVISLKTDLFQAFNFFNNNRLYYYVSSDSNDKLVYRDSMNPIPDYECVKKLNGGHYYTAYYVEESDELIDNSGRLRGGFDQLIGKLDHVAWFSYDACSRIIRFYTKGNKGIEVVSKSLYKTDDEFQIILNRAHEKFKDYLDIVNEDCGDCLLEIPLFFDASIPYFTDPSRYSTGELLIEKTIK